MHYSYREMGKYPDGTVRVMLYGDDQLIQVGHPTDIDALVKQRMKPGDTYQELFPKRSSNVQTYDEVIAEWQELADWSANEVGP